jgi:hypothetical protein
VPGVVLPESACEDPAVEEDLAVTKAPISSQPVFERGCPGCSQVPPPPGPAHGGVAPEAVKHPPDVAQQALDR